jgi:3-hydroxyisobutyrate dehydrogenase
MKRVGFLGLGKMGTPMAINLCRKFPVTVWNRTVSKYPAVTQAGARVANTPAEVAEQSDIIFTMMYDKDAIQSIMSEELIRALRGKTLVNTSSVSVDDSHCLSQQVRAAGGSFVEMPVSGSKVPAEQGSLVGMIAGDFGDTERVQPFLEPITKEAIYCGPIGSGLKAKFAVNVYLITMTAGLAEAMNLAKAQGLDLESIGKVLDASPMASPYSKLKIAKIINQDWSPQASLRDCYNITEYIQSAAEASNTQAPISKVCNLLYARAKEIGLAEEDMIAVGKVL